MQYKHGEKYGKINVLGFFNLINVLRKHWQYLHNSNAIFTSYSVQRSKLTISWTWRKENIFIIDKTDLLHQYS